MNSLLLWLVYEAWSDGHAQSTSAGLGPARKKSRVVSFYRLASLPTSPTSPCLSISVPSSLPSCFSPPWFITSDISSSMPVQSHTCNRFTTFISLFFGNSSTSTGYLSTPLDREWSRAWLNVEEIFLQWRTCLSPYFCSSTYLGILLSIHGKRNWTPALPLHRPSSYQCVFTPPKLLGSQSVQGEPRK